MRGKIVQGLVLASACLVFLGLVGCREKTVYVREGPPRETEYIIIPEAPPPIIVERRLPPPSARHIWVEGCYRWNGRKYDWERGHWVVPPHAGDVWIAPRYDRHERGYQYVPGRWMRGEQGKGEQGKGERGKGERGKGRDERGDNR